MFETWVLKKNIWLYKRYEDTEHWTEQHNGKFHTGTDDFAGALCINSKIIANVARITFITFLLTNFLSPYMFQLELSHLHSIPFH